MGISVVIPLWNKENEIARALDSVKRQTLAPSEVIVVDDGSTDSGPDVVRRFNLDNLRLVSQKNTGEGGARNRGIREAKEELIAFLDADDTWEPGFLEAIADMWQKYPGCGIYGTAWRMLALNGKTIMPPFRKVPPPGTDGILKSYFASVASGMCIWVSAAAVPKGILERVGGFPEGVKRGVERLTWLRIAADYPVAFCSKVLATWHLGTSNRVTVIYSWERDHPLVRTGLSVLSRNDLSPKMRKDLSRYITRTQIFVAKQLIRLGKSKEAREVLFECLDRKSYWLNWSACMISSFVPLSLFSRIYAARCRTLEFLEKLRRSVHNKLSA
jgi:glycosyltransferase involved in cell wall biosynthesis